MQSTPLDIDLNSVKRQVEEMDEIDNIHHVHVWKLDDTQIHLEAHLNLKNNVNMIKMMNIRQEAERMLKKEFGIHHITLQTGCECCPGNENLISGQPLST